MVRSLGGRWRLITVVILGLVAGPLAAPAAWADGFVNVDESGVAIRGYDPVAYFAGAPAMGDPQYTAEWQDAEWRFASAANRDAFVASPEKYAPQYGGWCAYGAAKGYAADTDPETAWSVHDGKLYLNWDTGVKQTWSEDIPGYLAKSEAKWPGIKSGLGDGTAKVYRK